ncbi:ABC-2 family transporter protein [Nonomuraea sp. NPDC050643]|uniref:ABC transporter permease n=1 Tax=Nonomuraea sp. NPDC050643 TaxID=3155660 RepID=UPI0034025B1C
MGVEVPLLKQLKRAWRIIRILTIMNLRARLEYRADFLISIALGAVWQVSVIVFVSVLLVRFPGMGGWTSAQILLLASMRLVSHSLFVLFLGRVQMMGVIVQEGMIDTYLLRPLPVYRQVQLSAFNVHALGDLAVATTMLVVAVHHFDLPWTPTRVGYVAAGLVGGFFVEAAIITAISSLALHFPGAQMWSFWVQDLIDTFGSYPLNVLPPIARVIFTYLLPIAFIAYLPASVATSNLDGIGVPVTLAAMAPLIGVAAFVASRLLWNASLRRYQGVNV